MSIRRQRPIRAGDAASLFLLIERHRLALFRIAFRELGRYDDAQDAVAEAVVRVYRAVAKGTTIGDFVPYFSRIVRNEARRIRQRTMGRRETSLEEPAVDSPGAFASDDLTLDVRRALRRLPEAQAQAMALFYLDGLTISDIAKALERPVGTVKWMLSRGRANLAPLLEGYGTMSRPKRAVVAAPAFAPSYRRELADALTSAGWNAVHVVANADDLLRFKHPANGSFALPAALEGCGLIVLDERIGRASAFELLPLLASARRRGDFALMLLLDGGRSPAETEAATLSAYVSGVDFLLTKPFQTAEFVGFVRQALRLP